MGWRAFFLIFCLLAWHPMARASGCLGSRPDSLCLALDYVILENGTGTLAIPSQQADQQVKYANDVWKTCGIHFQVENLRVIDPKRFNLPEVPSDYFDLDQLRSAFSNAKALLVVFTQNWSRAGSLGKERASAWTSLPRLAPYGAIIEASAGEHSGMVAHELGHYLDLDHSPDQFNLMSPIVYGYSRLLQESQCEKARKIARTFWQKMLR